ncbi:MAG: glycoside hydrolase, partial [Caldilinea sp.]
DLHDFPGQGTALVGVLDPFWEEKGYITAAEFCRFCNSTVPLARLPKRIWHTGERLQAALQVAHFGPATLTGATVDWALVAADSTVVASGQEVVASIVTGSQPLVAAVDLSLERARPAQKHTLVVGVGADGVRYENDWEVWVFPEQLAQPETGTVVTREIEVALRAAQAGGTVLLQLDAAQVATHSQLGFSSIFWNTAWTHGQAPHTLGILCDPAHPLFADFPTEFHSNWQWWELIHGAAAMQCDLLPPTLRPLVQVIDTWFEARRLALLIEARVGDGRLLVSSIDLESDLDRRLVARQLRSSLLRYLQSDAFRPVAAIDAEQVRGLVRQAPRRPPFTE